MQIKKTLDKKIIPFAPELLRFQTQTKNSYGQFKLGPKKTLIDIIEKNKPEYDSSGSLSNSGILLAKSNILVDLIQKIRNDNAKKEYYLTDIIKLMVDKDVDIELYNLQKELNYQILGVNTLSQLQQLEKVNLEKEITLQ